MDEAAESFDPTRRMLITVSVMIATIMQTLDSTIANVALPHMQGSLSATQEQISWVLTSYIVASAIFTPLTGFLADHLGRKQIFVWSVVGFVITSMLCGIATSLPEIVLYRTLQGAFGAAMIPVSQAMLLDIYPREKYGSAMAMWGVGVMIGPILGPALGGYLTDVYNWRWVFFINLPIGLLALAGVLAFVPATRSGSSRRFDFIGFILISVSLAAFQLMLDRGQTLDWFSSAEIVTEAVLAAICLYLFIIHMLSAKAPYLSPSLFVDRNFVASLIVGFSVGIVLMATAVLLPPFLQNLMGYPVLTTGLVLAPRGIGTMITMMLVGRLVNRMDPRLLIAAGLLISAYSLWEMSLFTTEVSEDWIVITGFIQGLGLGFVFVPLSTIAFSSLTAELRTEAAGIYTLMRNIGSSVGVSMVMTMLARNTQANHEIFGEHINAFAPQIRGFSQATGLSPTEPLFLSALNAEVTRQAMTVSFLQDFRLMMFTTLAVLPLIFLLRRPDMSAPVQPSANTATVGQQAHAD